MATKAEIADVLETAADLYESEQVEWCRGTWGATTLDGGITACASSALGLAAGIRQGLTGSLEYLMETGITSGIGLTAPEQLYLDVRKHVDAALNWRLPAWNDHCVNKPRLNWDMIKVEFVKGAYQLEQRFSLEDPGPQIIVEQVPSRTKADVIELFKGLAKDLRNEE